MNIINRLRTATVATVLGAFRGDLVHKTAYVPLIPLNILTSFSFREETFQHAMSLAAKGQVVGARCLMTDIASWMEVAEPQFREIAKIGGMDDHQLEEFVSLAKKHRGGFLSFLMEAIDVAARNEKDTWRRTAFDHEAFCESVQQHFGGN